MWHRIQTLYIAIATGLFAAMFFSNIATVIGPGGEELGIRYYEKSSFLVLMIMILSAQVCAFFCVKSPFLQARVCVIAGLLLIGFQIWLGIDILRNLNDMSFSVTALFPLAAGVLDFMAAKRSMVDEMTVQAVRSTRKNRRRKK